MNLQVFASLQLKNSSIEWDISFQIDFSSFTWIFRDLLRVSLEISSREWDISFFFFFIFLARIFGISFLAWMWWSEKCCWWRFVSEILFRLIFFFFAANIWLLLMNWEQICLYFFCFLFYNSSFECLDLKVKLCEFEILHWKICSDACFSLEIWLCWFIE